MSNRLKLCMTKGYLADAVARWHFGDSQRLLNTDEQQALLERLTPYAYGEPLNKAATPDAIKRIVYDWQKANII